MEKELEWRAVLRGRIYFCSVLFCFVFPGSERIELEEKKRNLKIHERGVFVCLFICFTYSAKDESNTKLITPFIKHAFSDCHESVQPKDMNQHLCFLWRNKE